MSGASKIAERKQRGSGEPADENDGYAVKCVKSCLTQICNCHHPESLRFLLRHGADPNVPTNHGKTALMMATSRSNMENVQLLLDHGADPTIAMADGSTALSIAEEEGSTEIAGLLTAAISSRPAS